MAKNSIRDYDATSGNNTDVQSVDISEGCAASGINNALREIMTDLKNVSTGAINLETPAADQLNVDNIRIDGNTISSTNTNGDITLDPNGTGDTTVNGRAVVTGASTTTYDATAVGGQDTAGTLKIQNTDNNADVFAAIDFNTNNNRVVNRIVSGHGNTTSNGFLAFVTENSGTPAEAMRIDSSGNVLVGKTSDAYGTAGIRIDGRGFTQNTRDGNTTAYYNRLTSDGVIVEFGKDSSSVGYVGTNESYAYIAGTARGLRFGHSGSGGQIIPVTASGQGSDNNVDLGAASLRFDDVYATSGVTTGSDQNDKQQIASLTDAEMTAAKAISKLFKTFKWNSAVAAKGDAARTHAGVMAQQVETALTDAGLNAGDYAFYMSNTWWETSTDVAAVEADEEAGIEAQDAYTRIDTYDTADDAPEGATQRTRLGIRYAELMAFVGAATEQRLADIETRLTALENA